MSKPARRMVWIPDRRGRDELAHSPGLVTNHCAWRNQTGGAACLLTHSSVTVEQTRMPRRVQTRPVGRPCLMQEILAQIVLAFPSGCTSTNQIELAHHHWTF